MKNSAVVIYHHLRNEDNNHSVSPKGGATMAIEQHADNPEVVLVGYTRCNPVDVFCKKTGRIKSLGHLTGNYDAEKNPYKFTIEVPGLAVGALETPEGRRLVFPKIEAEYDRRVDAEIKRAYG